MTSIKALVLCCIVLLATCAFTTTYAQTPPAWMCTATPDTTDKVECSTLLDMKCPTQEELIAYDVTCPTPGQCQGPEPSVCREAAYYCAPTPAGALDTCEDPTEVRAKWTETVSEDKKEVVFSRVVKCQAQNYLSQNVDQTTCKGPVPVTPIIATRDFVVQCLEFEKNDAGADVYSTCPTVDAFDATAQEKYCTGTTETVTQRCQAKITSTTPAFTFDDVVACDATDKVALVCPVYQARCVDKYAVKVDSSSTPPTPMTLLAEEEEESIDEMDAATCKLAKPTCAACTKDTVPKVDSFANPAPGLLVNCYVRSVEPKGSEEVDYIWTKITPTEPQYQLCLRAGGLTVDPATVLPAAQCPDISSCAYYKCQDAAKVFSFENCFDEKAIDSLPCTLVTKFPSCTGTRTLVSECWVGDDKQTDAVKCAAQTAWAQPVLTQDCKPENLCPKLTWTSNFLVNDETDSDLGEEETTSDLIVAGHGVEISVKLENVEIDLDKPWNVVVLQRTRDEKDGVWKYEKIDKYSKDTLGPAGPYKFTVDEELSVNDHFVIRAEWDGHVIIEEAASGSCEILGVKDVYPIDPVTCDEIVPPVDDDKDESENKDDEKDGEQDDEEEEEEESSSSSDQKQKVGREKLAIVTNQCRIKYRKECQNDSVCTQSTTDNSWSCGVCPQLFTGDVCNTCDLTTSCQNGSSPYTGEDDSDSEEEEEQTTEPSTFIQQYRTLSGEDQKDHAVDGQCRCQCVTKASAGASCGCKAIYIRFDFNSPVALYSAQTEQQWAKAFAKELARDLNIYRDIVQPYTFSISNTAPYYIVFSLAACSGLTAKQEQQVVDALSMKFATLQMTDPKMIPTPGDSYTAQQINSMWEQYRKEGKFFLPSASQGGGLAAVSRTYDPSCTSKCNADVTDPAYAAPSDTQIGHRSGMSGGLIFLIVILVILGVAALAAVIFLLVCVVCIGKNNKKRQFGERPDATSEMYATDM